MSRADEIRVGLMLLTRLPAGRTAEPAPTVADSAWSWPLAGAAVGLIAALVHAVMLWLGLPALPAACLAIGAMILATGGLHEDGLADLADGFGGGRTRERALEIMRDSRIGSFGAIALGLSLILRAGCLAALAPGQAFWGLIALGAASRASMPWVLHLMPPARDDGLGRSAASVRREIALSASALGFLACLPLGVGVAILTLAAGAAAAAGLAALAQRRIGGQTGDVCGAVQQAAEIAGWCALAAILT
jgi:adenosylcobinamide-GDP ribazoletransferase